MNAEASGALAHLRVLDLSRVLAGPWAGQMLGDLGADVIKIEHPARGDDTRAWGPPFLRGEDGADTGQSAYFLGANRNKRSVAIDFTTPDGARLVQELATDCDIVLENYKVGGLAAYGLDYASLAALNPGLVYCSITGFGQTGPYANRGGYDFIVQGMSGLMSVTGRADGEPGAGPVKVGVALSDILTGLHATTAILAAIASRSVSGRGQHIDLALLDVQVACMANQAMNWLVGGLVPTRLGNAHPNIVPYQDLPTRDGSVIVAVGNDAQFARFCAELGHPGWAREPRFATNAARVRHRAELVPLLEAATRGNDTAHWVETLSAAGIPCGPVYAMDRVFADPQVRARGLQVALPHPLAPQLDVVASPLRLSDTPVAYRRPPPLLGEHTDEVLRERLHLSDDELARLHRDGAIGATPT